MDADFAGDSLTRRQRSETLIMINGAPLEWFLKKTISIEIISLGKEFVAMRLRREYSKDRRWKLRMMDISAKNPCFFLVSTNLFYGIQIYLIQYWRRKQGISHITLLGVNDAKRNAFVNTKENPADLLTKNPPVGIN